MMNDENYKFTKFYKTQQETRWADINEIKFNSSYINILNEKHTTCGLPIISDGNDVWVDNTDTHSLVFGATGSKKSRLFCMPMINIMAGAGESFVVTDPKGELYDVTSGYVKKQGYNIVVLNYRDLSLGDMWNPLALPYKLYHSGHKDDAIARIHDFVNAISEPEKNKSKDLFWINAAKSIAIAILVLMLDECNEEECNLKTFTRFCIEFSKSMDEVPLEGTININNTKVRRNYLTLIMNEIEDENVAYLNYFGISGVNQKAKGDIQSTLFTFIQIFIAQEKLIRNMSFNTFDVTKLSEEKTAIYIIVPDEKTSYHFIATTFVKQCYETLIQQAQQNKNRKLKKRVNFILDEFANLPTIPDMPAMITAARSRNMRFFLVVQSVHQLEKKYGDEAQTIKGNCDNWVFLSSKEISLLEEISKLCGSIRYGNNNEYEIPLISVSQLQRLNKETGEALIFNCRQYPFITQLADISTYKFPKTKIAKQRKICLYNPLSVSPKDIYDEISFGKRHLPFRNYKM